ncbi:MAG: ABC transporter ATP-binding protein [Paracoccaceae bacterium]|nr:ABC transporter ATP-binding protein [Paracoccaceae bacterium]
MSRDNNIAVDIQNVTKMYGDVTALKGVSLDIRDNEFFTLLGPSGCGKTTLLRVIAGFEEISNGAIILYGQNIANLMPNERPVNTVFQQYALFPHMNVTENVMFGLLRLGQDRANAKTRVGEVLELVQLSDFADRMPSQLSGGQQQRVALARALAPSPKVLLLDEPLSALDLKLRQAVRLELQQIQNQTGITFIFVTHDQEEALTMSDRIAVIESGQVQQVGSAREIYEAPKNKFVADFIGKTNLLDVSVTDLARGKGSCILPGGVQITCPAAEGAHAGSGHLSVRPERITITALGKGLVQGTVARHIYLGTDLHVEVNLVEGGHVTVRMQNSTQIQIPKVGQLVCLDFEPNFARLLVD